MGSRDLLLEYWDPSIFRKRLTLEITDLERRLATGVLTKKMQN